MGQSQYCLNIVPSPGTIFSTSPTFPKPFLDLNLGRNLSNSPPQNIPYFLSSHQYSFSPTVHTYCGRGVPSVSHGSHFPFHMIIPSNALQKPLLASSLSWPHRPALIHHFSSQGVATFKLGTQAGRCVRRHLGLILPISR